MEDTKELAKAADTVEQNNEAFDNTFPWLSCDISAKTLEEDVCCNEHDLITRMDETIGGEELLSEAKENWWVNVDDINWEWMFPASVSYFS